MVQNFIDTQSLIKQQNKIMLNKYEEFFKISKSEECSLYTALSRQTGQPVLLKRFKTNKLNWDEVLKNKNMQMSQKGKVFPKMVEIFKNKGEFYVVYQKPTGPSLADAEQISPLSTQNFYLMFSDLLQHLRFLKSCVPGVYVLPEWIFVHRHTAKIVHFQPFFMSKEALSSDHVYLYKVENQIIPAQNDEQSQSSIIPLDKKKNLVFNIGMLAYKLLTGIKTAQPETEDDYLAMVHQISENAQKRVLKSTKDRPLASLVSKMLSNNVFQLPQLDHIGNFMHSKALQASPKKRAHTNYIEIQLQHLKLESHLQEEPNFKPKLRPCCAEKQASLERINEQIKRNRSIKKHHHYHSRLRQESPRNVSQPSKSFLPAIKKINPKSNQKNKTMMNLMNTTNSKPLMFNNNRSLLF